MKAKNRFWSIITLLMLSLALAWFLLIKEWWIFSSFIAVLWIANARWLFVQQYRIEKEMQAILRNSVAEDYNFHFPEKDNGLYRLLNLWTKQLRGYKEKKEGQEFLLEQVLSELPFCILLLQEDQRLQTLNQGEFPIPGLRKTMDGKDWPVLFPFIDEFIKSGQDQKKLQLSFDGEQQLWMLKQRKILRGGTEKTLLVLSNRQREHEEQEGEALEKILHVLTHEIMNSVSPISSLADTMNLQLKQPKASEKGFYLDKEQFADLQSTAQIILRRSEGLMGFVERYARFARLPKIQKQEIQWTAFLEDIQSLCKAELEEQSIALELRLLNSQRPLFGDRDLLSQLILNLIRNAQESLQESEAASIIIELDQGDGYHYLKIIDNGPSITNEITSQIFLPFFSTKQRGSGIGLSLSRKIAMAHGGRLYLQQKEGYKAFCLDLVY